MMDASLSRAILLKALLELLLKEMPDVTLAELSKGVPAEFRGPFLRSNASKATLLYGLPVWIVALKPWLRRAPSALAADPTWQALVGHVFDDEPLTTESQAALTAAPPDFPIQLWQQPHLRDQIIRELGGMWRLFRLSAKSTPETPRLNLAILNIRPSAYYVRKPSAWTHFAMWLSEEESVRQNHLTRVDGVCLHHRRLHLVGLLDKADAPFPASLVIEHRLGGRKGLVKTNQISGVMFATNTEGRQTAARFEALRVNGSDQWPEEDFRNRKQALLDEAASGAPGEFAPEHEPHQIHDVLLRRSRERLVFRSN